MNKQATKQELLNLKVGDMFQEFEKAYGDEPMKISSGSLRGWYHRITEIKKKPTGVQFILESQTGPTDHKYKTRLTINNQMNSAGVKHTHVSGSKVRTSYSIKNYAQTN